MPMQISPESALGIELAKWDKPYQFRPFPLMLYRAQKVNGTNVCVMPAPSQFGWRDAGEYQQAILHAEAITKQNQRIVQSDDERHRAEAEGWRSSPQEALNHLDMLEQDVARAAAEMNFGVRRMGEGAQREHRAADDSTHEHVVDLKPKRKYTRKSKAAPAAVTMSGEQPTEG